MSTNEVPPGGDEIDVAFGEFRRMAVPDRPSDEDLLARLGSLAAASSTPVPPPASPAGRPRNRLRLAAYGAAGLAAAVLVGWVLLTAGSPPAFAGVARAVGKHQLVRYKQTQTNEFVPDPTPGNAAVPLAGPDGNIPAVVGVSTAYQDLRARRFRTEYRPPGTGLVFLDVQDYTKGRRLMTQSEPKEATVFTIDGADVKLLPDFVREFAHKPGVTAERTTLDGGRVVKYRLAEGQRETVIWVDPKSTLPVRVEITYLNPDPNIRRMTYVWSEFEWDPAVADPDRLFSTEPPEGYTVIHRPNPRGQK